MKCIVFQFRLGLRRNSYTQYLIALAIVDTGAISCEGNTMVKNTISLSFFSIALIALDELHQYRSTDRRTLIHHTVLSCKLYYYIRFIFYSMSSW